VFTYFIYVAYHTRDVFMDVSRIVSGCVQMLMVYLDPIILYPTHILSGVDYAKEYHGF
jgi:hypothetical protein